jgi:hypothetical protein
MCHIDGQNNKYLIWSTHLRVRPPSGLFPSGFPSNNIYEFLWFIPIMTSAIRTNVGNPAEDRTLIVSVWLESV